VTDGATDTGAVGVKGDRGKPGHTFSTGWAIAAAIFILIAGSGTYVIVAQVNHNQNTIESLRDENRALRAEVQRASMAECDLLNGRRQAFYEIAVLEHAVVANPATPPDIRAAAAAAEQSIVKQLDTEKLPGCDLDPLPPIG
jgi:hypothetical protein